MGAPSADLLSARQIETGGPDPWLLACSGDPSTQTSWSSFSTSTRGLSSALLSVALQYDSRWRERPGMFRDPQSGFLAEPCHPLA